jgi:hypothetical protein
MPVLDEAWVTTLDEELSNLFVKLGGLLPDTASKFSKITKSNLIQIICAHYTREADLLARASAVMDGLSDGEKACAKCATIHKEGEPCIKTTDPDMPPPSLASAGPCAAVPPNTSLVAPRRKVHCKYLMTGTNCDTRVCQVDQADLPELCQDLTHRDRADPDAKNVCGLWHLGQFGEFPDGYVGLAKRQVNKDDKNKSVEKTGKTTGKGKGGLVRPSSTNHTGSNKSNPSKSANLLKENEAVLPSRLSYERMKKMQEKGLEDYEDSFPRLPRSKGGRNNNLGVVAAAAAAAAVGAAATPSTATCSKEDKEAKMEAFLRKMTAKLMVLCA